MDAHIRCDRNVLRGLIKPQRCSDSITHPLLFASQCLRYRKLEVILTMSVEKLGKAGETVKVAPGYFRNHLMPKMFDVPNIEKYAYLIRQQQYYTAQNNTFSLRSTLGETLYVLRKDGHLMILLKASIMVYGFGDARRRWVIKGKV
ncbi:hypothetical protein MKX03_023987 [Papaver bracteatum]|nr:hypothetical protein MKX03_023987 [Papaver bracteatum]